MSEERVGYTISVGKKETSETGAMRNSRRGKGRFDLISPIALARLAFKMEDGAEIYGDRNWEKGMPLSRFADGAVRHIIQAVTGMKDEDHLAAAMFNIMCWMHGEHMIKSGKWPYDYADLIDSSGELTRLFEAYADAVLSDV